MVKRAVVAGTIYFLALFTLGFILGTIRVLVVAPLVGPLLATVTEVPIMLAAAVFACRWAVHRWQVPRSTAYRLIMTAWFIVLLGMVETIVGALLFGRSLADQAESLATPAGMIGIAAQLIAAVLPLLIERGEQR